MERNENICRQTDNQADTNSKTEAHSNPLWSVDSRGAGQYNDPTHIISEYVIYGQPLMEEHRYEGDEDEEDSG